MGRRAALRGHETRRAQRLAREPIWMLQERLAAAIVAEADVEADALAVGSDDLRHFFRGAGVRRR